MNTWKIVLVCIIAGSWLMNIIVEILNLRHADPNLPEEFKDVFDEEKYRKSQRYLSETTRFGLIEATISMVALLSVIQLGLLQRLNVFVCGLAEHVIFRGLLFGGMTMLIMGIANLPFSWYGTFVIEEKYGFNKTTLTTFITDRLKGAALGVLLGAPVFAALIWFFDTAALAWLWAWLLFTGVQLVMVFIGPVLIMPLFNKYEPLEDGALKDAVTDYANRQGFKLQGVFKADGSRRSTKANAFFTGFGRFRRIVLFDTLIDNHTVEELVAVLAHEMGHFRRHHIPWMMLMSTCTMGAMFYFIGFLIARPEVYQAFGMAETESPVYAGLLFIGILFEPVNMVLSVFSNWMSRKFEFQADRYAADTVDGGAKDLILGLKKLTATSLGNLTPHPLKVFLEYSHPPVLERIRHMRRDQ